MLIAPIVTAIVQGLVAPAQHAATGAANKALVAAGLTASAVTAMPTEAQLFQALGYFFGWSSETCHYAAIIAAFVIGFVTTYIVPNRAPPATGDGA